MEQITKSLTPVALLVAAGVVFVLGTAFLIASDATLASSTGAASDLAQAGRWLQFLGGWTRVRELYPSARTVHVAP